MLEALRRTAAIPQVPVRPLLAVGTLAGFGWLLTQDLIDPLAVFALQLYLAF